MKNIFGSMQELVNYLPQGKEIILIGGSFDLIHVGHLHLLEYASSVGDLLIVAVLSDRYTRSYKGERRPIIGEKQRVRMVASLRCVDYAYVSDVSASSIETLEMLKPHHVVFGEQSSDENRIKKRLANIRRTSPSTKVHFLPRYAEEGVSTSGIIQEIVNRYS